MLAARWAERTDIDRITRSEGPEVIAAKTMLEGTDAAALLERLEILARAQAPAPQLRLTASGLLTVRVLFRAVYQGKVRDGVSETRVLLNAPDTLVYAENLSNHARSTGRWTLDVFCAGYLRCLNRRDSLAAGCSLSPGPVGATEADAAAARST